MMLTAAQLSEICYALREKRPIEISEVADLLGPGGCAKPYVADETLVEVIDRDIAAYRNRYSRNLAEGISNVEPPSDLAEQIWLMGWLLYEATWQRVDDVQTAFPSKPPDSRAESEAAAALVKSFATSARALPWPAFAARALGALRADALVASKKDTRAGYAEAFALHEQARRRHDSFRELHGDDPSRARHIIGLKEMLLQLALSETGTACRTAEQVIARWPKGLDGEMHTWGSNEDEAFWIQLMFDNLLEGVEIGTRALTEAASIESGPGFAERVTEERMALATAYRNPANMTARAGLLVLALCSEMERLGYRPSLSCVSWPEMREEVRRRVVSAYEAMERPVTRKDGTAVPLAAAHEVYLVQLRLNLALISPGAQLPSRLDFATCLSMNPLDDKAVEALSQWLIQPNARGERRDNANLIGSATMPAFIRSVEDCRVRAGGERDGYREWRARWFALDRYATEPDRRQQVEAALGIPIAGLEG
jgi:hypothetical protein